MIKWANQYPNITGFYAPASFSILTFAGKPENMTRSIWFLAVCLLLQFSLAAQSSPANNGDALLFNISYAYQLPAAGLASRFGPNFSLGGGLGWGTTTGNWQFSLEGQFLFGSRVKEDVLAGLRTAEGYIIGADKDPADIQLRQRGLYLGLEAGKTWNLSRAQPRSGLHARVGAGLLQHRIRIQEDPFRAVPQVSGDYQKGYDRLCNGIAFRQFLGYQILSHNKQINFNIGLEAMQGLTESRRSFQYDLRGPETGKRLDLLFGIRASWILPFYFGEASDIQY